MVGEYPLFPRREQTPTMPTRRTIHSRVEVAMTPEAGHVALREAASILDATPTLSGVRRVLRAVMALYGAPGGESAGAIEADLALLRPRLEPLVRALPDPSWLAGAHERLLDDADRETSPDRVRAASRARKRTGSYYTPDAIVERLLDLTLEQRLDELLAGRRGADAARALLSIRVCDPACGSGRFLLAAGLRLARRLRTLVGQATPAPGAPDSALAIVSRTCLFGMDLTPSAAELCRFLLWHRAGGAIESPALLAGVIRVGDALLDDWAELLPERGSRASEPGFDVVVGNPPFLNQLRASTSRTRRGAARLADRFGEASRAYADTSALFLPLALRIARDGARVALIQPQSFLAARDAQGVRDEIERASTLTHLWLAGERVFEAHVLVCAPVLRKGRSPEEKALVVRVVGESFRALAPKSLDRGATWAPLIADALGVPEAILPATGRTVSDWADATADFRDQYYGLRGMLVEDADLTEHERPRYPALVTTGLVDLAQSHWGARATRFDHAPWRAPRVDLARLASETPLGAWARARLVPKLVLATQTQVLEVLADPRGEFLPAVPLITVVPRDPDDLWHLGALLMCPALAAESLRLYAGTALALDVIKLSAKQVLRLPAPDVSRPRVRDHWDRAARAFQWASVSTNDAVRRQLLAASAREMMNAFEIDRAQAQNVLRWWLGRL